PGKRNHVDIGMIDNGRTENGSAPGHDIVDASGQAGLLKNFAKHESGARGELARLRDNRAAGGENEGNPLSKDEEREIPRCDQADDADGFARHQSQHSIAEIVEGVAVERTRLAGGVFEYARSPFDLAARL